MAKYRSYRRKYRPKRFKQTRIKRLVTGQNQPTMLEKIASYAGPVSTLARAVMPAIMAINTEAKFKDVAQSSSTIQITTPFVQCLNLIAQGSDESDRIGNSILCKNLSIHLDLQTDYTTNAFSHFRVIILVDKQQAGGGSPARSDLFQSINNINSAHNKDFTDRYSILKDEHIMMNQLDTAEAVNLAHRDYFFPLDFHTRFIGGTSATTDMGNNSIYLFVWNSASVSQSCQVYTRLNYTDN